jgi:hypothetical protein
LPSTSSFLNFFQKSFEEQYSITLQNIHYLLSLHDWKETLEDEDEITEKNRPCLEFKKRLLHLLSETTKAYSQLTQERDQLRATNQKLVEETQRLSVQPREQPIHKNPLQSQLNQLQTQLRESSEKIQLLDEANDELRESLTLAKDTLEASILEKQGIIQDCQKLLSLLPGTTTLDELSQAIEGLKKTEAHSDRLAGENQALLFEWENLGLELIPHPEGKPPTPQASLIALKNLIAAFAAAVDRNMGTPEENRMSGAPPKELTKEQLEYLWKDIPEDFRSSKQTQPTTIQQLRNFLEQISCPHPRQAALALGDETGQQEWDASIEQMEQAAEHECPTNTRTENRSNLFKASEVPEFTNTREYDDFRSSLKMFFQSTEAPSRREYGTALLRILGTFKDPIARQAAKGWDVSKLVHNTSWPITWNSFLNALDDKFQSATLLQDTIVEWKRCRPKPEEKPVEFFNRFEALTNQLIDVRQRTGAPTLSDPEISERLLTVLPAYLTTDARRQYGQKGELLETKDFKELRKYFEISWAYLPKPATTSHSTTRNFQTGATRAAPAHNHVSPKEPKTYLCGFYGNYDTSPAVPLKFRGSIFTDPRNPANNTENLARKKLCADAGLCINCRRDQSQHPTIGANFKPIHMNPTARRGPANPESPTNDQGQRLLEAPPTTPA